VLIINLVSVNKWIDRNGRKQTFMDIFKNVLEKMRGVCDFEINMASEFA
jgi:hypothetical protein